MAEHRVRKRLDLLSNPVDATRPVHARLQCLHQAPLQLRLSATGARNAPLLQGSLELGHRERLDVFHLQGHVRRIRLELKVLLYLLTLQLPDCHRHSHEQLSFAIHDFLPQRREPVGEVDAGFESRPHLHAQPRQVAVAAQSRDELLHVLIAPPLRWQAFPQLLDAGHGLADIAAEGPCALCLPTTREDLQQLRHGLREDGARSDRLQHWHGLCREVALHLRLACLSGAVASVAVAAMLAEGWFLMELPQQPATCTSATHDEIPQGFSGLVLPRLHLRIDWNVIEIAVLGEDLARRGLAVTSGTSDLLEIVLNGSGRPVMHYSPHVRLVDAHAKGDGGDDHSGTTAKKVFLRLVPLTGLLAGMVAAYPDIRSQKLLLQNICDLVRFVFRWNIHDGRVTRGRDFRCNSLEVDVLVAATPSALNV
mmetsp:Transcript_34824/g.74293  ORF Transcript_34824/g.74293 Transcript_34824/m.74293 type:complete len:423 (-) Transcript_34824:644-1912(-)